MKAFTPWDVTTRVDTSSRNEATVYFDIVEGTKVTIDDITFEGNEVFSDRKLRGFMQTNRGGGSSPGLPVGGLIMKQCWKMIVS